MSVGQKATKSGCYFLDVDLPSTDFIGVFTERACSLKGMLAVCRQRQVGEGSRVDSLEAGQIDKGQGSTCPIKSLCV